MNFQGFDCLVLSPHGLGNPFSFILSIMGIARNGKDHDAAGRGQLPCKPAPGLGKARRQGLALPGWSRLPAAFKSISRCKYLQGHTALLVPESLPDQSNTALFLSFV